MRTACHIADTRSRYHPGVLALALLIAMVAVSATAIVGVWVILGVLRQMVCEYRQQTHQAPDAAAAKRVS